MPSEEWKMEPGKNEKWSQMETVAKRRVENGAREEWKMYQSEECKMEPGKSGAREPGESGKWSQARAECGARREWNVEPGESGKWSHQRARREWKVEPGESGMRINAERWPRAA